MQGWFGEDAEQARAYVGGLEPGVWRDNVATSVAEDAIVAENPSETLRFLEFVGVENSRRLEVQEWAALAWGKSSYAEASAWAAQAVAPEQRERLLAAVNVGYANTDPLAAAESLLAMVKNRAVVAPALGSIMRIWAAKEPTEAAEFVASFPASAEQKLAVGELLEVWGRLDEASARGWLEKLSDAEARDHAELVMARIKAGYVPEEKQPNG